MSEQPEFALTPQKIVKVLDKFIIGQADAKRAVAIALRNRIRRMRVEPELRQEIAPKNILMIGPTGVGKTEIARRLAKLANAPFIKIEATKFTEVGFVGRDVESIIRDLTDIAVKQTREQAMEKVKHAAEMAAEERILDVLLPGPKKSEDDTTEASVTEPDTRSLLRKKLRQGELDDKEIEIEVAQSSIGVEIMAPPGMEDTISQLQNMFQNVASDKTKRKKMRVKDAFKQLKDDEAQKLINDDDVKSLAVERVEQTGIVFLDEVDKITQRSDRSSGADVSREGVQRDLIPLIEGSTVSTKYGMVKTDHILFIASGAFHFAKPSDLIPELQGRLPIRVELNALSVEDFMRILTEPDASLTKQYHALLETDEVQIEFTEDSIKRIAELAWHINEHTENIGARRLHTVMERLLEDISYTATELDNKQVTIDAKYVDEQLDELCKNEDLSRFIL